MGKKYRSDALAAVHETARGPALPRVMIKTGSFFFPAASAGSDCLARRESGPLAAKVS